MAYGAGIGASFAIKTESVFNTGVTVDHFTEMNSESLKFNKHTVTGSGLRSGGKVQRSQRRVVTTSDASGDLDIDLPTRGLGLYLAHATGTFPSPTTVASGVYSYTYTLGDTSATSFTTQATVPQYGGSLTTKTLTGCKVSSFELSVAAGEIAKAKFSIDAAGFTTATSPATYSYPASGSVFHFAQGAITVDGSSVANIKDFSINVDNVLKNDRYNLGSAGIKSQQIINGFRMITGKITAEFTDTTLLAKFLADTSAALVLTFTGDTISSTYKDTLRITVPVAKFDADTPNVDGPGVVDVGFTFTALDNGTDEPLTIFYQTADSAL
jgi:hypothetical protein